ncbi:MAG: acyl-ACP--UDP-N-acetylglucosamine O-acyltransferase [Verrucomicrobiota bacterium]
MIHPSAIVESSGTISEDVEIGPFAVVTGEINIGPASRIEAHAQILNHTSIGAHCLIGAGSVIGSDPQDLAFDSNTSSGVAIGDHNTLRENVTIHRSSLADKQTTLGHHNYLHAGAHVGHDCAVGHHNVIGNDALLGGYVTVGNHTRLGAGSVYHQFVRIGNSASTPDLAGLSLDLPPFVASFAVNRIAGLNHVALEQPELEPAAAEEIKKAYKMLLTGDLNLSQALKEAADMDWHSPEARDFIAFLEADSKKGVCSKLVAV